MLSAMALKLWLDFPTEFHTNVLLVQKLMGWGGTHTDGIVIIEPTFSLGRKVG
jgi:hypothetical protein